MISRRGAGRVARDALSSGLGGRRRVGAKFADNGWLGRIVGSFQIHHTLVHKVK